MRSSAQYSLGVASISASSDVSGIACEVDESVMEDSFTELQIYSITAVLVLFAGTVCAKCLVEVLALYNSVFCKLS